MKVTDHALIRYIERVEQIPLGRIYKEMTGKNPKRADDGMMMQFIIENDLIDTTRCKRYIARMFKGSDDAINRNEFHSDLCFVIRDGWLITIIDMSSGK